MNVTSKKILPTYVIFFQPPPPPSPLSTVFGKLQERDRWQNTIKGQKRGSFYKKSNMNIVSHGSSHLPGNLVPLLLLHSRQFLSSTIFCCASPHMSFLSPTFSLLSGVDKT